VTRSLVAIASVLLGCGYHTVYGGAADERLRVVVVRSLVPDAVMADEVAAGARETLAREGALAAGDGYPRVEISVLRADEASAGIAAPSTQLGGSASSAGATGPRARATEVGLVARACLVRVRGGECERDTGDVRAIDLEASDVTLGVPDVGSDLFHHRDASRAVAKRLGDKLALHMLGAPSASDEAIGRER
jgi:hypothetical protein